MAIVILLWAALAPQDAPENPFGVMLGAEGMSIDARVTLARELGVTYFRPNAVVVDRWKGSDAECDAAVKAGLKLVLTVRANGGGGTPTEPPKDLDAYKKTLGEILDACKPALLVVENEENSKLFYTGTPDEYSAELKAAVEVAHARGVKVANGGLVSLMAALLTYEHYVDAGEKEKARDFAERSFEERERKGLKLDRAKEQVEKGRALLKAYKDAGVDFVNIHWYVPDGKALEEAVACMREATGLPVMTNEMGQHDVDAKPTRTLLETALKLKLPYALWYSVDAPKAKALMEKGGDLRESGKAFKAFMAETFKKP